MTVNSSIDEGINTMVQPIWRKIQSTFSLGIWDMNLEVDEKSV